MTTKQLYDKHISGEVSNSKFLYEVRRTPELQHWITNLTSYDDTIRILKNKGIITEVKVKGKNETLNIDQVNPYEYKKGMDYELGIVDQPIPQWGVDFTNNEEYTNSQKKVLKNLTKDPLYYTNICAQPQTKQSKKIEVSIEMTEVGDKKPSTDKKNNMKPAVKGKDKSNVKDTLGNKEKAKGKPKGVKELTMVPKKEKGVQVMEVPKAKGKTLKMEQFLPKKKSRS